MRHWHEDEAPEDTPRLEDPHAELLRSENYVSDGERRWLAWVKRVEQLLGHDLDGDQERDGYSMDAAYAAWESGASAEAHASEIEHDLRARREASCTQT